MPPKGSKKQAISVIGDAGSGLTVPKSQRASRRGSTVSESSSVMNQEEEILDPEELTEKLLEDAENQLKSGDYDMTTILLALVSSAREVRSIAQTVAQVPKLKKEVTQLNKEMETLKKQVKRMELDKTGQSVIIRGLPIHPTALQEGKNEIPKQTLEVVDNLLHDVKIAKEVWLREVRRFPFNKAIKSNAIPSVKVTLGSKMEVENLMSNLKHLSTSKDFSKIRVSREYPPFLAEKYKTLEEKAYYIRKANKGRKTLIILRDQDLELLVKEPNQAKDENFEDA